MKFLNLKKGNVKETLADISDTKKYINCKPKTKVNFGIKKFISWYKDYYKNRCLLIKPGLVIIY